MQHSYSCKSSHFTVKLIAKLVLAEGAAAAPACRVKPGQHQDKGSSVRGTEEWRQVLPPRSDQPRPHSTRSSRTRAVKKWWKLKSEVAPSSGNRGSICTPGPIHSEVCCLPRAQIRADTRKLSSIIQPSD